MGAMTKTDETPPADTAKAPAAHTATVDTRGGGASSSSCSRPLTFSLVVIWLSLFCDYVLMTLVIPIFPQLDRSETEIGSLFSAKAALQVLSAPLVARYIDSFELEPLIFGLFIEAVSNIVFSLTDNYWWWFGARAVQGIASSAILSSGFLHIQRVCGSDHDKIGTSMSIVTTGIISGVTVGPPLGGLLYSMSPATPFLAILAFTAGTAFVALRLQLRIKSIG